MTENDSAISDILTLLKQHPEGLTVKKISEGIGRNRMSVARYLDNIRISGYVDMVAFGQSKIYSLSNRIPVSDILDYLSDCIVTLDEDCHIVFGNISFLELVGKEFEEISGRHIFDILNPFPVDYDINSDSLLEFDNREISVIKNGKEKNFRVTLFKTVTTKGNAGIAVFFRDMTELNKIKSRLKNVETLYDSLVKGIRNIIFYVDYNGIITYTGPGSIGVLGYRPSEMTGRSIFDFISGDKAEIQSFLVLGKNSENSTPYSLKSEFMCRDGGHVDLSVHIFPEYVKSSEYCGFQTICTEIPS